MYGGIYKSNEIERTKKMLIVCNQFIGNCPIFMKKFHFLKSNDDDDDDDEHL